MQVSRLIGVAQDLSATRAGEITDDPPSIGEAREVRSPMRVDQPFGPGFQLDGHVVEWQKWRFHVRTDQRVGTIVSTVTYSGGERPRPVLYEGHPSEIFVPYMDPAFDWYRRNFLDACEFSAGGLSKPLLRGLDCPEGTVYFDGLISNDEGQPKPVPNVICLFEREACDMAWRHFSDEPESRRKRDLVVRSAAVLGNYDYVFDWTFQQDGSIRVGVGATGIAEVKSSAVANADAERTVTSGSGAATEAADAYGRLVDQSLIAGESRSLRQFSGRPRRGWSCQQLCRGPAGDEDPSTGQSSSQRLRARTHDGAHGEPSDDAWQMENPAFWRVPSTTRHNHVGYPTSYQLAPGMTAGTLLTPDDYPGRRAGFIDHQLWVTPHRYEERYAAGDYPTLCTPGQGLPAWTKANRRIEQSDVVLWYTSGCTTSCAPKTNRSCRCSGTASNCAPSISSTATRLCICRGGDEARMTCGGDVTGTPRPPHDWQRSVGLFPDDFRELVPRPQRERPVQTRPHLLRSRESSQVDAAILGVPALLSLNAWIQDFEQTAGQDITSAASLP